MVITGAGCATTLTTGGGVTTAGAGAAAPLADGLDKDILNINNTSLNDSLDRHRLITLMVYMGKGVAVLHVRMGKGASAEDERDEIEARIFEIVCLWGACVED